MLRLGFRYLGISGVFGPAIRKLAVYSMNRHDRRMTGDGEARLRYLDGEFQIISPGSHVRCAVTGQMIQLETLRYWSVELQEPYADAEASLRRFLQIRERREKGASG